MTADELSAALSQFTGTEAYYSFTPFAPIVLTDGAHFLAEQTGAFWLMDIIASIFPTIRKNGAGFAHLNVDLEHETATFTLDDGDGNVLYTQKIEYTDFPLEKILLYVMPDDDRWVILLPSEY